MLRKYLKDHRLTQASFAAQAGVSTASLSLWLSEENTPSGSSAMLVQSATGGAVPYTAWFPTKKRRAA
jgi:transcriptional regulator with XRE-family HTH domain